MATPHWSEDEGAFEREFDLSYSDFMSALALLDNEHQEKYENIRKTSAKAAVLWAIHAARRRGILVGD
jgi:hypothetical protein